MKKNILIILFYSVLGLTLAFILWLFIVYGIVYCLDIAFNFGITFKLVFGIASATFIVNFLFKIKKICAPCVEGYKK